MEIQKRVLGDRSVRWRVRWRQGGRYRARTFDRKGDALNFGAELRRRQQLGTIATLDTGRMTLPNTSPVLGQKPTEQTCRRARDSNMAISTTNTFSRSSGPSPSARSLRR